jgi:hypothetical protein
VNLKEAALVVVPCARGISDWGASVRSVCVCQNSACVQETLQAVVGSAQVEV